MIAVLGASMIAPTVVPMFPAYAAETSVREMVRTGTPSDASKVIIADEILVGTDLGTPGNATKGFLAFGSSAFWSWFQQLYADALTEHSNYEDALDSVRDAVSLWYNEAVKQANMNEEYDTKEYPTFDDTMDAENSTFWEWFYQKAVKVDEDGNILSYNNAEMLDWIVHSEFDDVFPFLITLSQIRSGDFLQMMPMSAVGNLWPDGYGTTGDLYSRGNGTEESPYIVDSVEDLRTLAVHIANDNYNEDTYYLIKSGTYDLNGAWIPIGFQRNGGGSAVAFRGHIAAEDGANIKNIGFKANSNLGITSEIATAIRAQKAVGFFGEIGAGATVTNLYINTSGNTMEGTDYAGILAGHAVDATIKNCTVVGTVKGVGYVGGIVGFAESSSTQAGDRNMIIEDCRAEKVAAYTTAAVKNDYEFCNGHSCVGGIAGYTANTSITDSYVSTNTGAGNHIYGNGSYVGGIVGVMEYTDIYNCEVYSGEIGSSDSYGVGGIVGGYNGGALKVGRFSATVVRPTSTNNYSAAFIGTRVNGAGFTYGADGDIAYLFADSKTKADTGVCGSRIQDDGVYDDSAHIGYWHTDDNYYTIVSGSNVDHSTDYFYTELERGILNCKQTGQNTETINHFTADKQGKPTRGYLLTVNDPMVDGTKAAEITAYINGSYKPVVTSEELGAFAAGDVVYLSFQNMSDGTGYYQMADKAQNPYYNYYQKDHFRVYKEEPSQAGVTKGSGYYITMPASDVTVGAEYKKVGESVTTSPNKVVFELTQIRSGSRENPTVEWYATAYNANKDVSGSAAVITDAKGTRWESIKLATITPDGHATYYDELFWLNSLVNGENNDKFNLSWKTANDGTFDVISSPMVEGGLVNGKNAYVTLNLKDDSSIARKVKELTDAQAAGGYKDSITTNAPYWYHAIVTASMLPGDSSDATNPPRGYTDIDVKLHIKDNTNVSVTGVSLNKNAVTYDVVRHLSGSRRNPTISYTVNGMSPDEDSIANLSAAFNPDYFTNDSVYWYLSEAGVFADDQHIAVPADQDVSDDGTIKVAISGSGDKAYYHALVTLKGLTNSTCDNAVLSAAYQAQDAAYTSQMKAVPGTTSSFRKYVKVSANDTNNNSVTDTCLVTVNYKTEDKTEIMPEEVFITGGFAPDGTAITNASNLPGYHIIYTFAGDRNSEITSRKITMDNAQNTVLTDGKGVRVSAEVKPDYDNTNSSHQPYDRSVVWSLANASGNINLNPNDILVIDPASGQITVRGFSDSTNANEDGYSPWIQSLIAEGKMEGVVVPVRIIAKSNRDNSLVAYKDINISFTGNSMDGDKQVSDMSFDLVLTKEVATSLSGTGITESESWSGNEPQQISATATGTNETPLFTVYNQDGEIDQTTLHLMQPMSVTSRTNVLPNTNAAWIRQLIQNRSTGNIGTKEVIVKAKTANQSSEKEYPVTINFRYDATDLRASEIDELPDGFVATPEAISEAPPESYDINKASVKDRQIALNVVATQGNYSVNNPGSRSWSYGIIKLDNTTYSAEGVKVNDAIYEISGDAKNYCKVENGYLVPIKGLWEDLISSGEVKGQVSGVVTAKKDINGKITSDSYKISIDFRYDKAVLDTHEEHFSLSCVQKTLHNGPQEIWSGNDKMKLNAHIYDESGKDVTPIWESSDPNVATVDADGNVTITKTSWMKAMIESAKEYGVKPHTGTKEVVITAKHPGTGATADSCKIFVTFNYENVVLSEHEKTLDVVLTASGNRSNPTLKWEGSDFDLDAMLRSMNPMEKKLIYSSSNEAILIDQNGKVTINPDSAWLKSIKDKSPYTGSTDAVINVCSEDGRVSDQCNLRVNLKYVNKTSSSSGSGSSSGGGGGGGGGGRGSSSSGVTPNSTTNQTATNLPAYVLGGGIWTQNAIGQWFYTNGRTFSNEWAAVQNPYADAKLGQPLYDWFHFGTDSVMSTGWFTDQAGDIYYLHTISDNTLGHMLTGWQWIPDENNIEHCYFFETESNGFKGRLYRSSTTPDGYQVNEKGQWVQNGTVMTRTR